MNMNPMQLMGLLKGKNPQEMAMSAVCMFVESLSEFAETLKEKEIIRKHLEKMKKI